MASWLTVVSIMLLALVRVCPGQTCPLPAAQCAGTLHCGGEWDFEAGYAFSPHMLAGQCAGPPGGGAFSCVPGDKLAHVAVGWSHWASFPTWETPGYWGTVAFNENKNCDNVHRGNRSQELTMTCANGVGVIYKQAVVPPTRRIRVQAMMKFTPNGPTLDVEHALGIDTGGGTDPTSSAIQWTIWNQPVTGTFNQATIDATTTGSMMTVFIRQRAFEPACEGQTFMIDNVQVLDLGPAGPTIEVIPSAVSVATPVEADPPDQAIVIRNVGIGTLNYDVIAGVSWLSVSPVSGSATTEMDTLTVSFHSSAMDAGRHESTITITDAGAINSPVIVPVIMTITEKPGDFDHDRDVDQADFGMFQRCYSGSGIAPTDPACAETDLDRDADVDATDFALFQGCFSGPGTPSNPHCLGS